MPHGAIPERHGNAKTQAAVLHEEAGSLSGFPCQPLDDGLYNRCNALTPITSALQNCRGGTEPVAVVVVLHRKGIAH